MTTAQLIRDLEATRDETLTYFALGEHDLARTYGPGKWSIHYLLHHLTDSETVFYERVRRVLSEPRPVLLVYDQDAWAKSLNYSAIPLELVRPVFEATRRAIIYYAQREYERNGHRKWVHSVDGERTLKMEFDKVAAHNAHHLKQIHVALGKGNAADLRPFKG